MVFKPSIEETKGCKKIGPLKGLFSTIKLKIIKKSHCSLNFFSYIYYVNEIKLKV